MTLRTVCFVALCACVITTVSASAQSTSPSPAWPPEDEPSRETERFRRDDLRELLSRLAPAHRAKIQAIIARVNDGRLRDLGDAAEQIDGTLSFAEGRDIATRGAFAAARIGPGTPDAPSSLATVMAQAHFWWLGMARSRAEDPGFIILDMALKPDPSRVWPALPYASSAPPNR